MGTLYKMNLEARSAILNSINKVADIVESTYGPNGKQVAIKIGENKILTNDGLLSAENVRLNDRFEQLGAEIFVDIAKTVDEKVGGGRTTSIILGRALANSLQNAGMKEYRELLIEKDQVIKELAKMAKQVTGREMTKQIALYASESEDIAEIVADAYDKVGLDGLVRSEESSGTKIELEITKGFEIPIGYKLIHMITDVQKKIAEIKDTQVVIINKEITTINEILPVINKLVDAKYQHAMLFVKKINDQTASVIAANKLKSIFMLQFVEMYKLPRYEEHLEDIAILTGAKIIDNVHTIETFEIKDCGKAQSIEISEDKTIIQNDRDISKDIEVLKTHKGTERRIATLTKGVATIKVGAVSDTERGYIHKKVNDAIFETKAALQEGVVDGAGMAYVKVADKLKLPLLDKALRTPRAILEKSGIININIIDPVKVERTALEASCSVMRVLLTTGTLLLDKETKK